MAYKVTKGAKRKRDGNRPAVLFNATQHAREWIAAEIERRLFTYMVQHKNQGGADGIKKLLSKNELWFVPVVNVDGYDYTFVDKGTRLWRKNLRDVDGGGFSQDTDGVDTNRNWPTNWNFDLEGASADPANETYHGAGPASEPEVKAMRGLEQRIGFKFQIDYHSFAQLILYPEGWQVETLASDAPLMAAIAGDDDNPAIPGFDPDVSAELYTTNGDVTDDALRSFGTQAYTVELDGGTGPDVGGTVDGPDSFSPAGSSSRTPRPTSRRSSTRTSRSRSISPARRRTRPSRSRTSATWRRSSCRRRSRRRTAIRRPSTSTRRSRSAASASTGRSTAGASTRPGRASTRAASAATTTRAPTTTTSAAWSTARSPATPSRSGSRPAGSTGPIRSPTRPHWRAATRCCWWPPRTTPGPSPAAGRRPELPGRLRPGAAGLAHRLRRLRRRRAVAHRTVRARPVQPLQGRDLGDPATTSTRASPGQPGGTGVSRLLDQEIIAARDYMNDGGKVLVAGKTALQGAWDQFLYNPLTIPPAPFCASNQTQGNGDADDPPGQNFNCVVTSNDFQQYWLGAYLPITLSGDPDEIATFTLNENQPLGTAAFTLNGADSKQNQDNLYSFLTTSSLLPAATYPQFASQPVIKRDGPAAFDPKTGTQYMYTGAASSSYMRLTQTVDLTAATTPTLQFAASYDAEQDFDFVFVEAHTVGQDNWTTLPDLNGNTSADTGGGLSGSGPVLARREPVPPPLHHPHGDGRRHRVHADRHVRRVERVDGQLRRLPGLERRPERLRGPAGRALHHLRNRSVRGRARGIRGRRLDRRRRNHADLDLVRDGHRRLDRARCAGR